MSPLAKLLMICSGPSMRTCILALLGLLLASTPVAAADPPAPSPRSDAFFRFSETQVSYTAFADRRGPFVTGGRSGTSREGRGFPGNQMSITHANAWEYGTNFLNLDVMRQGSQKPAGSSLPNIQTYDFGATNVWFSYRGTLSGNALTGTRMFQIPGVVKDVSLAFGADWASDNTQASLIHSRTVAGVDVALDVPFGFVSVRLMAQQDRLRFANLPGSRRNTETDIVPRLEAVYTLPLSFTNLPLSVAGFAAYTAPRGASPFNMNFKAEFVSRTNLVLDVGALAYGQPNRVKAFVGFAYLLNTQGLRDPRIPGTENKSVLAGVSFTVF